MENSPHSNTGGGYAIDLSLCETRVDIRIANCLKAKDRGVTNCRHDGTGVLVDEPLSNRGGIEIARTLSARDYKGFGTSNQMMNGVMECTNMADRQI